MSCWDFQTWCSRFCLQSSFFSFGFTVTRNDKLARLLEQVVEIGLRGCWGEFQDTPLQMPRIQLPPHLSSSSSSISPVQNPPLEPEHADPSSSSLPPLKDSQTDVSTGGVAVDTAGGSSS